MAYSTISPVFFFVLLISAVTLSNAQLNAPSNKRSGEIGLQMNWIERKIKEKIESLREVLKNGEPALGIPVLDPYSLESKLINLNTSVVSASTDVKDFSVMGLSSYSVDDVRVSLLNMSAKISLSWTGIKAKGDYTLDGEFNIPYAGKAPLYGNGTARGLVYQVWIDGELKIDVLDEVIQASDLDLSWKIVNPQIRIDGLFGGVELGDTINQLIEDIIPKLDVAYHDQIKNSLQKKILKLINDYLTGTSDQEDDSYVNLLQILKNE